MLMIMEIVFKEFDLEQLGRECTQIVFVRHCNFLVLRSQDISCAVQTMRAPRVRIHRIQDWFERCSEGYISVIC